MNKIAFFWRKGLWALLSLSFLGVVVMSMVYLYLESQLPDVEALKTVQLQVPLRIYTQEGLLIEEYGEKRRIPVTYDKIPPLLVHAVLVTEDQRFFEHSGVDVFGLGRAAVRMIQTGTKSQGGSTITMQVARNFFLSRKKTFLRKFNEILLAIKIDRELSKEKILELYLNKIYLGNRAYGVGAAAKIYYGKTLQQLTLGEIATIAGLPQAPSSHNPIANPNAAKVRRDHVLARLLEEGFINQEQYQNALKEPITAIYHGSNVEVQAPYVGEMIRQTLYSQFGEAAYTKGYKVYTTVKAPLQKAADDNVFKHLMNYDEQHGYRGVVTHLKDESLENQDTLKSALKPYKTINALHPAVVTTVHDKSAKAILATGELIELPWEGLSWARPALKNGWVGRSPQSAKNIFKNGDVIYVHYQDKIWHLAQIPEVESAVVSLNPKDGAILSLVGGFDFEKSNFNRATQSIRQPGSSFKPFIYAAALSKGYTLATLINDAPLVVNDPSQPDAMWRPHNVNMTFNGPMRLKEALVLSRNLVSIRILNDIGIDYAINFVTPFGFQKATMPKTLSLALGSLSVTPMDLTAAYATFANGGYKVEPYLIDKITDNGGNLLFKTQPVKPVRIIPEDVAFLMNTALKGVIEHGTAKSALQLNRPDLAGKTGTTNEQVDAWFVGFNPDIVTGAWVGFDTPKSLHRYAATLALPLWIDYMRVALKDFPLKESTQPENIVAVRIDPASGLLARASQKNGIVEYFRESELPGADESDDETSTATASPQTQESLF